MSEQKDVSAYTADEIKHARELQETGSTEITELVVQELEEATSTDWERRAELLEALLRDTLLYLKSIAPYSYSNAPRAIELLDRAAELGIIPEVPREKR
jgi:TPR repeat protein